MAQKTTVYRPTPTNPNVVEERAPASSSEVVEHTDDLLDEIDACLETNALEVLRAYHQRGGQ